MAEQTRSEFFSKSPDVVLRKVGEEAILVPIRNRVGDLGSIFTLTEVALTVWSKLDGKTSLDAIVTEVCEEYDVDRDTALADVRELVGTLREEGLVDVRGAES